MEAAILRGKTRHSVSLLNESLPGSVNTSEAGSSGKMASTTKGGLFGSVLGAVNKAKSSLFSSEQSATSVDRASESNHAMKNEKVVIGETDANSVEDFAESSSDHEGQATPYPAAASGCESGHKSSHCRTTSHGSKGSSLSLKMPWKLSGLLSGIMKRDASDDSVHMDKPQELPLHTHQSNRRRRQTSQTDLLECVDQIEREMTNAKNDAHADCLEQALNKFDELQQQNADHVERISKLEIKIKKLKKENKSLTEQLKCRYPDATTDPDSTEKHSELDKYHEQKARERYIFELAEKESEIKTLKERCESRYLRIKSLEQERADLSEQAKQFEINYRVEMEENQSLKNEIKELQCLLDNLSSVSDVDESMSEEESTVDYKKTLFLLKSHVKHLNEDLDKLKDHSKVQSRQILTYRQQVEMIEVMEKQLTSMVELQQKKEEECQTLQDKLKKERKEMRLLKSNVSTQVEKFEHEKKRLNEDYTTLVRERDQVLKSLQSMATLSRQVSDVEQARRALERELNDVTVAKTELQNQLDTAEAQLISFKNDFEAERRDNEATSREIADLKKKIALLNGEDGERNDWQEVVVLRDQLVQHQQAMSALEQVNRKLEQETQSARKECQFLQQENSAKSSQVKQYAKEVHRLKQQLENAKSGALPVETREHEKIHLHNPGHHHSLSDKNDEGIAKLNDLYKMAQDDNERLSSENFDLYNQVEELKKMNAQLKESLSSQDMASPGCTSLQKDSSNQLSAPTPNESRPESQPPKLTETFNKRLKEHCGTNINVGPCQASPQNNFDSYLISSNMAGSHQQDWQVDIFTVAHSSHCESLPAQIHQETATPSRQLKTLQDQELALTQNDKQSTHLNEFKKLNSNHSLGKSGVQSSTTFSDKPQKQVVSDPLPCADPQGENIVESHCFSDEQLVAIEDSVVLFENPLQREVDDEIHQQAAEVIQEVSRRRREAKTDPKRPFDPNLVCPMCRKQFRIGEIQKFRRHVNTCTGTSDD